MLTTTPELTTRFVAVEQARWNSELLAEALDEAAERGLGLRTFHDQHGATIVDFTTEPNPEFFEHVMGASVVEEWHGLTKPESLTLRTQWYRHETRHERNARLTAEEYADYPARILLGEMDDDDRAFFESL